MAFFIDTADLEAIRNMTDALVLGAFTTDGRILIRVADGALYRGHRDWVSRDGLQDIDIAGGFSLLIKNGEVHALFPLSELNRHNGYSLTAGERAMIGAVFPRSASFRDLHDDGQF